MTVLRNYLLEKVDSDVAALYREVRQHPAVGGGRPATSPTSRTATCSCSSTRTASVVCDNVPADHRAPDTTDLDLAWTSQVQGEYVTLTDATGRGQWRVIADAGPAEPDEAVYSTLIVGIDLADVENTIARYAIIFFGFSIVVILLGAATTQLLVTSTFTPLRDVERTAARFAAGDYSQRLGGATPNTEVGRLNRSLNTMLARIDRAFADRQRTVDQMRRFVGDASHELRTPLVSVRGYAELYRMGAHQPAGGCRAGDGPHRARGDPHGRARRGPARAGPPRRGQAAAARPGRPAADRPGCRARHLGVGAEPHDHRRRARAGDDDAGRAGASRVGAAGARRRAVPPPRAR